MNKLKLKDGRILSYEDYGSPKGKPLFYFHGWPASRLSGKQLDNPAKKLNLRVISPDRPGFGHSTFKPKRKLLDWPDDVLEIANHLKLKRFSILGSSGGVPYTFACAHKLTDILDSVITVAGLGPTHSYLKSHKNIPFRKWVVLRSWTSGYNFAPLILPLYRLTALHSPRLFQLITRTSTHKRDRACLKDKNYRDIFNQTIKEAFRQGTRGPLQDLKIYGNNWGFKLKEINNEVTIWHGTKDSNAPFWLAKFAAQSLRKCETRFMKNNGHFILAVNGEKILSTI